MSVAIDEDTFNSYMPGEIDDKLKAKIDGLLDTYSCFTSDHTSFFKHHSHHDDHHHRHSNRCNRNRKSHLSSHKSLAPPTLIFKSGTSLERLINAYLNKVTNQNFEKVNGVMTEIVAKGKVDIKITTQTILGKCEKHTCYIDIFVRLLCNMYSACDAEKQALMYMVLLQYMQEFLCAQEYLKFKLSNDNYSSFCDTISMKASMIGKHRTILSLTRHLLNDKKDMYFQSVFNEVKSGMTASDDVAELLLDFMLEFIKCDRVFHVQVKAFFDGHGTCDLTNKARFKVMDIYAYKTF
jgi:hypothetical protein